METVKSNLTKHEFFISGPNKGHYQCFIGYSAIIANYFKWTNDKKVHFLGQNIGLLMKFCQITNLNFL